MEFKIYSTFALLIFTIILGTLGYYLLYQGQAPLMDCLYMTLITLSTVGYGEVLDVSQNIPAKIFTMILMVFGIGVLAYAISLITAFFVEGALNDMLRRSSMNRQISKLKDHYIVCGGGDTGYYVVEEIQKMQEPMVLIEWDDDRIKAYRRYKNLLYILDDATDDEILIQAGVEKAKGIVAVLSCDKDNLFITVTARQMNPKIRIVAKGVGPKMSDKLFKAGADAVVCPNLIGGMRLASEMLRPTVVGFLDRMLRHSAQNIRIEEMSIPSRSSLVGKTIQECRFKEKYNLLVLAILSKNGEIEFNPPANTPLQEGSTLIVMGDRQNVRKMQSL